MTADLIEAGRDRPRLAQRVGARASAHRVALLVVGLVVLLALAADQWQQRREFQALVSAIGSGEAGIAAADDRVGATFDYYSPVLVSSDSTAGLRRSYQNALAAAGLSGADRLAARGDAVSQIRVLPWHRGLAELRTTYVLRLQGWEHYLAGLATDPDQLFGSQDQLGASTGPVSTALLRAVPWSLGRAEAEPALGLLTR